MVISLDRTRRVPIASGASVSSLLTDDLARRRNGSKMSHVVATELRRRIVRGQVAPGDTLPSEAQLMELLDVSRDTLRGALRMLESESLIYIRRGRNGGAVVRRPDLRAIGRYIALLLQTRGVTLDDIHEARRILEVPAVALVADHLSPELTRRLEALHDSQINDRANPVRVARSFAEFDQGVVDLTGNGMLSMLSGIFRDSYAGEIYTGLRNARGRSAHLLEQAFATRAAVVAAARQGEGDRVVELWLAYLDDTRHLGRSARRRPAPIDVTAMWRAEVAWDRADARPDKIASNISVEIRSQIAEGRLNDGDRLAALPELATAFGVLATYPARGPTCPRARVPARPSYRYARRGPRPSPVD